MASKLSPTASKLFSVDFKFLIQSLRLFSTSVSGKNSNKEIASSNSAVSAHLCNIDNVEKRTSETEDDEVSKHGK